jgi:hypothetical protein
MTGRGALRLALADAFELGRTQRIELLAALLMALLEHALGAIERAATDLAQACVVLDPPGDVALDPPQEGAQFAQRLVGALEMLGVRIALMRDQRMLAVALVGLAQRDAVPLGEPHQRSLARCISLASVGKATAFSCTVVSTMTLEKSEGFAAPLRVAAARLSWISATSFSSPMRWRQRVSDERSKVSLCWKNSSPQNSWK